MERRRDDVVGKELPWLVAERDGTVARLRLREPLQAAARLPLLPRGFDLSGADGHAAGRRPAAAGRTPRAFGSRRCAADARRHRRLRQHRVDRRAPRVRLRAARHDRSPRGWKFDRWLDVVLMQRRLGHGDERRRPDDEPAPGRLPLADACDLAGAARRAARRCTASICTALSDRWGWLLLAPTLLGAVRRPAHARTRAGRPARLAAHPAARAWSLRPRCSTAIIYGLTPDDAVERPLRPVGRRALVRRWLNVIGAVAGAGARRARR